MDENGDKFRAYVDLGNGNVNTFRKMNKDVNDYKNGNSQYVKGKGWQ